MNKHQRKRSRRIKKWMGILNAKGYNLTYRQTKRRMRMFDQTFNEWYPKLKVAYVAANRLGNPFLIKYLGRWHYTKGD